jgi:HSP20 family protein
MAMPTRWNPIRGIASFDPLGEIEDLVRGFGVRNLLSHRFEEGLAMRMDVSEDDKEYRVAIDMPGVDKDRIDVSITGNRVAVSAKVDRQEKGESAKSLYTERFEGEARREFMLPSDVDTDRADAAYDGGVLKLTLPKRPGDNARKLSVH